MEHTFFKIIKQLIFYTVLFVIFVFTQLNASSTNDKHTILSKNIKIIDGDTIKLDGIKIRFSGIDAPESYYKGYSQKCFIKKKEVNCGQLSKDFLINLVGSNIVSCKLEKKPDQYNRKLGECFLQNQSISRILVKNGYAFDYSKYSKRKYAEDQKYAKSKKLGLWDMEFEFPWDFRARLRKN